LEIPLQFGAYAARARELLNTRAARAALKALRVAVPVLLLAYLSYRLTQIGWSQVWNSRPVSPAFYVILLLQILTVPVGETIIYGRLWNGGKRLSLLVFLRKQYLNIVLDYSGEAYLYFWAKRTLKLPNNTLLHAIKDTNVLSAGASLIMVWLMFLALVTMGGLNLSAVLSHYAWIAAFAVTVPLVLSLALIVGGQRVSILSRAQMASTFCIQLARSFVDLSSEFGLWWFSGALPSVGVCLQFVALQMLVTRLPFIPGKGLLFAGAGIAAAGLIKVPAPPVAAVLVIRPAFHLLVALVLVGIPWLFDRTLFQQEADQAVV
jgi:hypothetical protein